MDANKFFKEQVKQVTRQNEKLTFPCLFGASRSPVATKYFALLQQEALATARAMNTVHGKDMGEQAQSAERNRL